MSHDDLTSIPSKGAPKRPRVSMTSGYDQWHDHEDAIVELHQVEHEDQQLSVEPSTDAGYGATLDDNSMHSDNADVLAKP